MGSHSDAKGHEGIQGWAEDGPLIGPPTYPRGAIASAWGTRRGLTVVRPCGFLALLLLPVLLLLPPCSEAFLNQKATSTSPRDVLALQPPVQAPPVKAPRLWGLRRPSSCDPSSSALIPRPNPVQACRAVGMDEGGSAQGVGISVVVPASSLLHRALTPPLVLTQLGAVGLLGYYLSLAALGYGLIHLRLWWKRRWGGKEGGEEGGYVGQYRAYARPHVWALAAAHRQRRRIGRLSAPLHGHAKALLASTRSRTLALLSSCPWVGKTRHTLSHLRRLTVSLPTHAPTRQEAFNTVCRHMHAASSALACLLTRAVAFLLHHPLLAPLTIAPLPSLPLPPPPPPVTPFESLYPPSPFDALLVPTRIHPTPRNLTNHAPSPALLNATALPPLPDCPSPTDLPPLNLPPLNLQSRSYATLPLMALLWLCMLYIIAMLMLGRWPMVLPVEASVPVSETSVDLTPAVAGNEEDKAEEEEAEPEQEGEREEEAVEVEEEKEAEEKGEKAREEVVVPTPVKPRVVINEADFFDAKREGSDEESSEEEEEEVVAKEEGKGMEQEEDEGKVEKEGREEEEEEEKVREEEAEKERKEEERRREEEGEMAKQEEHAKERRVEDRRREEGEREGMDREEGQQRDEEKRERESEAQERLGMEQEEAWQRSVEAARRERRARVERWEREREEQRRTYDVDTRPVCVATARECICAMITAKAAAEVSMRGLRQRIVAKRGFVLQHMGFLRECVNKGIEQGEAGKATFRERELSSQAVDYVDRKVTHLSRDWDELLQLGHEAKTLCTRAVRTYKDWVMYPFDTELQAARVDYLHFALDRLHRLEEQRAAIAHRSSGGESSNNHNRGGGNNNQGQGGGKGGASRGAAAREEEEAALREEEAGRTEAMYRVRQGLPPQPYVPGMTAATEPAQ